MFPSRAEGTIVMNLFGGDLIKFNYFFPDGCRRKKDNIIFKGQKKRNKVLY